jgi:hypothetical protein
MALLLTRRNLWQFVEEQGWVTIFDLRVRALQTGAAKGAVQVVARAGRLFQAASLVQGIGPKSNSITGDGPLSCAYHRGFNPGGGGKR